MALVVDQTCGALVDTGSTHMLISTYLYTCLPRVTPLYDTPSVQSITGHDLFVRGTSVVQIGGLMMEVLLFQRLGGVDLLIGANLCAQGCILDFAKKEITLGDEVHPIREVPELDFRTVEAVSVVPSTASDTINHVLF